MTDSNAKLVDDFEPLLLELGKALYICQAFESTLIFLHALMTHEEAKGENGAFQASWDFHSTKTLGQTLNALRKRIDLPADLDRYLEEGIKCRNKIVHGFMTNAVQQALNPNGRHEILSELNTLKTEVKNRDVITNKLVDALLSKYETSNEKLKSQAAHLYALKNSPENDSLQ